MAQLARGFSFVMYEYAPDLTFGIPFPYLDPQHVRVFAGEPGTAVEVTPTWVTSATIAVPAATPDGVPIPPNAPITIRRFTPRDRAMVTYQDGAQLPAADLNLATQQLLYIIQESIDFGTYGGSGLPGGGTGWADGTPPPDPQIQEIVDRIMQSQVFQDVVLNPIIDIDTSAETILEEVLRSNDYFDEWRKQGSDIAKAFDSITVLQDGQQSAVTKIDGIYTRLDTAEAGIVNINTAVSNETSARAEADTQIIADYTAADTAANVRIYTVQQAVSDETSARATAITALDTKFTDKDSTTNARVAVVEQAVSDEASARATAITQVRADYAAADDALSAAVSQTLNTSYATKNYADATASTQVQALANGAVATIQERFEALVDGTADPAATPKWSAVWSVKMTALTPDGKPVVAGLGLGMDPGTGSSFIVSADQFAIIHPNYTAGGALASVKFPFVVGVVGGTTQVGIDGNLVVDKTIKANHISVNSLAAITGNLGTVNSGTFRTYNLDASGNIIDPAEFRVELTNNVNDTWPLWIGSGVKNANNAVFWVDRSGNAKFAGKVSALNITDNLQARVIFNYTTTLNITTTNTSDAATLPAPVLLGQTHVPVIMIAADIHNTHSSNYCGFAIAVQKLVSGTWVDIKVTRRGLKNDFIDGTTFMLFDDPTSAAQSYRLQVRDTGYGSASMNVEGFYLYAFGLR